MAAIRSGRKAAILVAKAFQAPVTVTTGFITPPHSRSKFARL
jgi:hypothetical protein